MGLRPPLDHSFCVQLLLLIQHNLFILIIVINLLIARYVEVFGDIGICVLRPQTVRAAMVYIV